MKIRSIKTIENNKYSVSVSVEEVSQVEEDQISKFGDPEINVGGLYGEEGTETSGYVLPDNFEKLFHSFRDRQFKISFDSRDYDDAEQRADMWTSTIIQRIVNAVTELRAKEDNFSEEKVENL